MTASGASWQDTTAVSLALDTLSKADALSTTMVDTMVSKDALSSKLKYNATDSMIFNVIDQNAFLYGKAEVYYEDIVLKADFIEINWSSQVVHATGTRDSLGVLHGTPQFTQGGSDFRSESMSYNFGTKKGKITQVITKQDEGYIHGEIVKKDSSDNFFIQHGAYTTCELDTPHFYISASKLKVIKDNKIVTGPAYLVIEDVPTPLAVPFGLFPNKKGQASGLVIPQYGSDSRGFFLRQGGYYFGINDFIDAELLGNVTTRGDYGLTVHTNYANRYHFSGNLGLNYVVRKNGDPDITGLPDNKDFLFNWSHQQDAKARPGSRFSARVMAGTSSYYNNNLASSVSDALTNTYQSSVSYSRTFRNSSLTANINHDQNTLSKALNLSLPKVNYSVNRFYPLKRGRKAGEDKWYEHISASYSADLQNTINTYDSLFPNSIRMTDFRNGIQHVVPISTTFNVFKHLNITPSLNYTERWYLNSINKQWAGDSLGVQTDTVNGFSSNRDFIFNTSASTMLYGMFQFKNRPIKAIRHVLTPVLSYGLRPDFSDYKWGFYGQVKNAAAASAPSYYAYNQNGIFGAPPAGKYSLLSLNLKNNLEMKVRNRKDTITGEKKIKLLDFCDVGTAYNMALDSLKLQPIRVSAGSLILQKINVNINANYDPYSVDSLGRNINTLLWDASRKAAVLRSTTASMGFSLNNKLFGAEQDKKMDSRLKQAGYADFALPWTVNINYNINYLNPIYTPLSTASSVTQSLTFSGDFTPTPMWRITYFSGYDLVKKEFTPTNIMIRRDLHCWEMKFNWIPFGTRKGYFFTINVKSSVLQDLKLEKKKDAYNN